MQCHFNLVICSLGGKEIQKDNCSYIFGNVNDKMSRWKGYKEVRILCYVFPWLNLKCICYSCKWWLDLGYARRDICTRCIFGISEATACCWLSYQMDVKSALMDFSRSNTCLAIYRFIDPLVSVSPLVTTRHNPSRASWVNFFGFWWYSFSYVFALSMHVTIISFSLFLTYFHTWHISCLWISWQKGGDIVM